MLNCGVFLPPHNLLDNSDFTNPVNSRGQTSYSGIVYSMDKWHSWDSNNITTINDGSISVSVHIVQDISKNRFKNGNTYTIALCASDGTIYVNSGVYTPGGEDFGDWTHTWVEITDSGDVTIYIRNGTYIWAALYEGAYDVSTLPPYAPKGKHVEMLNCNVPLAPHNLLDNSDFRNYINQRGEVSTAGVWNYCIDRWRAIGTAGQLVWHNSDHVALGALRGISQAIENKSRFVGKTYTLAAKDTGGVLYITSGTYGGDNSHIWKETNGMELRLYSVSDDNNIYFSLKNLSSDTSKFIYLEWAALYEGSYDASTLPAYQPKGYAAELAECQRYFERLGVAASEILGAVAFAKSGAKSVIISMQYRPKRVDRPTLVFGDVSKYRLLLRDAVNASVFSGTPISSFDEIIVQSPFVSFRVTIPNPLDRDCWVILQRDDNSDGAYIDVNADL